MSFPKKEEIVDMNEVQVQDSEVPRIVALLEKCAALDPAAPPCAVWRI